MNKNTYFSNLIGTQAEKFEDKVALYDRENLTDTWKSYTWKEFAEEVQYIANALLDMGVKTQDKIGQFSQNKAENLIVDFALFSVRCVNIPVYPTLSLPQVEFIVDDAEVEIMFVGEQEQYDIASELLKNSKTLKKLIVFDQKVDLKGADNAIYYKDFIECGKNSDKTEEVNKIRNQAEEKDFSAILYTSGTSGKSKGVIMTHEMYNHAMKIHELRLTKLTADDVSIAFLPLAHVFERLWCYYLIFAGATIYINHRPLEVQQTIKDVRPTLMCAIPRFWEKVFAGVQETLSTYSPFKLGLVTWAVAVGKKYNIDYLRRNKNPDVFLKAQYKIADKLVFSKVKTTIGVENASILPVAGAKLADSMAMFFLSIGIPIVYGYGLTESTATVSCFIYNDYEIGTVGTVMPEVEVKIGEENEILLRGKTITPGYYKNEEENKKSFTEDGWFRTGDAGSLAPDGKLKMTERLKDLYKTSNGKYIAPQDIETRLAMDKYIEQAVVVGDDRNYVTALIVPSVPALESYAKANNIQYSNVDQLLKKQEIYSFIESRIKEQQQGMANYEMVKKFTLIKTGFSIETGELTNKLSLRRAIVLQKYKNLIDDMYEKQTLKF